MKEFYALQKFPNEAPRFVAVKGCQVKFKGFEDFEFFYYRTAVFLYCVIEARSGMSASTKGLLKEAKELARRNLEGMGPDKLKAIIDEQVEEHGLSPRYKQR